MEKLISSAANEDFRKLLEISKASGIRKHGQFLTMGEKLIFENKKLLQTLVIAEVRTQQQNAIFPRSPQWILAPALFNELDIIGTHFNLILCAASQISQTDLSLPPQGLELIAPLGDPTNLGALARSAWAFGITKMILTEEATTPFHPRAIKASAGAVLKMHFSRTVSLLKVESEPLWALEMSGDNLTGIKFPKNLRLILGEEGPGLGELKKSPRINKKISIPIQGVESLNATVAASIVLFEYRKQFPETTL